MDLPPAALLLSTLLSATLGATTVVGATTAEATAGGPGLQRPSPAEPDICVISPRLEQDSRGRVSAEVATATPTLVVAEAIDELQIERGGRLVWHGRLPADAGPGLPLPWPLAPLAPGETAVLRIRPQTVPTSGYATVRLRAAPSAVLRSGERLVASLGEDPASWEAAVDRALIGKRFPLAWALLFDPRSPASRGLQGLRAELLARGCGPGGSAQAPMDRPIAAAAVIAVGAVAAPAGPLAPRPLGSLPPDLQKLVAELRRHGFTVLLAPPPRQDAYGLFDARGRRIWVAPVAFDLGIGRQTLVHEAVHAAQSCPRGVLTPIGWRVTLPAVVEREIGGILTNRYGHGNLAVEREAFALQGQPDAVPRVIAALRQRCRSGPAAQP